MANPTAKSYDDLFDETPPSTEKASAETAGGGAGVPEPSPSPEGADNGGERTNGGRPGGNGRAEGKRGSGRASRKKDEPVETSASVETSALGEREQEHLLKRWGGELNRTGLAVRAAEKQLADRRNAWLLNVQAFRREAAAGGVASSLVEREILKASLEADDLEIPER